MKVVITKKQYKDAAYKFLTVFLGKLKIEKSDNFIGIYGKGDSVDDNAPMTIWVGTQRNHKCKKDLTLYYDFSHQLDQFFPLTRKKIFSDVLVKYVYDKTGIKCDCVDYSYDFDLSGEKSQQYRYNVKKKKKTTIRENFLTEANLKNLLINKLGVDLTGKIHMVTNSYELPFEFNERIITPQTLRLYLNKYGPMYVIEIGSQIYLYQYQQLTNEVRKMIVDTNDRTYSEDQILNKLGIPPMGLTLDDIVDTFVEEGEE